MSSEVYDEPWNEWHNFQVNSAEKYMDEIADQLREKGLNVRTEEEYSLWIEVKLEDETYFIEPEKIETYETTHQPSIVTTRVYDSREIKSKKFTYNNPEKHGINITNFLTSEENPSNEIDEELEVAI